MSKDPRRNFTIDLAFDWQAAPVGARTVSMRETPLSIPSGCPQPPTYYPLQGALVKSGDKPKPAWFTKFRPSEDWIRFHISDISTTAVSVDATSLRLGVLFSSPSALTLDQPDSPITVPSDRGLPRGGGWKANPAVLFFTNQDGKNQIVAQPDASSAPFPNAREIWWVDPNWSDGGKTHDHGGRQLQLTKTGTFEMSAWLQATVGSETKVFIFDPEMIVGEQDRPPT